MREIVVRHTRRQVILAQDVPSVDGRTDVELNHPKMAPQIDPKSMVTLIKSLVQVEGDFLFGHIHQGLGTLEAFRVTEVRHQNMNWPEQRQQLLQLLPTRKVLDRTVEHSRAQRL